MPFIDLLDSINIKYDNGISGLTSNDVKNAIDELAASSGGLTDAVFPTWAGFQNQGSTAAQGPAGTTNINFSTSNKHALTGTTDTTIGTFTFPQANAHYSLLIPSTVTVNGVSATGKTQYGQASLTAGKGHIMSIYYDGTTAHWQMSEEP